MNPDTPAQPAAADPALARLQRHGVRIAAAVAGVLLAGLVILFGSRRQPLPELTPANFAVARRAWQAGGLLDYRVEVQVHGRQSAVYEVEVRRGEVVRAIRNGLPLKQQRTLGTWSIPGMFETIQTDVDHREAHRRGTAAPHVPNVALRCFFDPQHHYPARYHRTELTNVGNNQEVSWEVRRFELLPAT